MKQELRNKFKLIVIKNHWRQVGFDRGMEIGLSRGLEFEQERIINILEEEVISHHANGLDSEGMYLSNLIDLIKDGER